MICYTHKKLLKGAIDLQKKKILILLSCTIILILILGVGLYFHNKPVKNNEYADNVENGDVAGKDDNSLSKENLSIDTEDKENDAEIIVQDPSKDTTSNQEANDNSSENSKPEPPKTEDDTSIQKPEQSQSCQHTYTKEFIENSCTTDGRMIYTCTKCNHSYEEVIKAAHSYEKYFCALCGKIDPEASRFWAINAWLSQNGQLNGAGTIYCYPTETAQIKIYSHLDSDSLYLEYFNESTQEQFMVYLHDTYTCQVNYSIGNTRGRFSASNVSFSSAMNVVFDSYSTPDDNPIDETEFASQCAQIIDGYMYRIQNEILLPSLGLSLNDLGFYSY